MNKTPTSAPGYVPAGALALVLVISIVISAILLGLVGVFTATFRENQLQRRQLRVQRNARSGMAYLLANSSLPNFQPQAFDLYGRDQDSVTITKRPWGIFEIAQVVASSGSAHDTLVALLGSSLSKYNQAALYVADNLYYPLAMVGNSQLIGDAYLPTRGARTVLMPEHLKPSPAKLVTGQTYVSRAQLPLAPDSALRSIQDYATHHLEAWLPKNAQFMKQLPAGYRSYWQPPLVWNQPKGGVVRNVTLVGQILLVSAAPLIIDASARLDGVLIMAPKVTIKEGFRGKVQVFARDTINVEDRCQLDYPSALGVFTTSGTALIRFGEHTKVIGVAIAGTPASSQTARAVVQMRPTSIFQGQLFTTGTLLNPGQIMGTAMCQQVAFQYHPSDSRYDNYLVDAVIDRTKLPASFLSSPWLNPNVGRGVMQWLN